MTAQRTLELAQRAKELWLSQSPSERRRLLEMLVSNPILDGKTVRYDLRKPFQLLSELKQAPDWRAR